MPVRVCRKAVLLGRELKKAVLSVVCCKVVMLAVTRMVSTCDRLQTHVLNPLAF